VLLAVNGHFCSGLRSAPAVAAGLEEKPWSLEKAVEMTADYMRRKEDAQFEMEFARAGI